MSAFSRAFDEAPFNAQQYYASAVGGCERRSEMLRAASLLILQSAQIYAMLIAQEPRQREGGMRRYVNSQPP